MLTQVIEAMLVTADMANKQFNGNGDVWQVAVQLLRRNSEQDDAGKVEALCSALVLIDAALRAFCEGRAAYQEGRLRRDCPYQGCDAVELMCSERWEAGWEAARLQYDDGLGLLLARNGHRLFETLDVNLKVAAIIDQLPEAMSAYETTYDRAIPKTLTTSYLEQDVNDQATMVVEVQQASTNTITDVSIRPRQYCLDF